MGSVEHIMTPDDGDLTVHQKWYSFGSFRATENTQNVWNRDKMFWNLANFNVSCLSRPAGPNELLSERQRITLPSRMNMDTFLICRKTGQLAEYGVEYPTIEDIYESRYKK